MKYFTQIAVSIALLTVLTAGTIDLDNLFNYAVFDVPDYVNSIGFSDNLPEDNQMDDKIATLGRVLFYDKNLSTNNTTACASCHKQELGFGDAPVASEGANGLTKRRSMRLSHIRFGGSIGTDFFWDGRETTIEALSTKPIQDHFEMGFSGENGDPGIPELLVKLAETDYYPILFDFAFGDEAVTEDRMQRALSQFMRSLNSFDSAYDIGRAQVEDDFTSFPNYTEEQNQGKSLFFNHFTADPVTGERLSGGLACGDSCHGSTEGAFGFFNTDNANNGQITEIDGTEVLNIRKAPSLRDMFNADGELHGPLFHDGSATTFNEVLDHYNEVPDVENLDPRLTASVNEILVPQRLNITDTERSQVIAFLKTLTSNALYTDEKLSNPFDENDNIELTTVGIHNVVKPIEIAVFPNPTTDFFQVDLPTDEVFDLNVFDVQGKNVLSKKLMRGEKTNVSSLPTGTYFLNLTSTVNAKALYRQKLIIY